MVSSAVMQANKALSFNDSTGKSRQEVTSDSIGLACMAKT